MTSVVYFIRAETTNLIKIGWTDDLSRRMSNLQGGSPDTLTLLVTASGGATLEGHLHDHFADERVHGEWFVSTNRILDFIDKLKYYGDTFLAAGFGDVSASLAPLGSHTASSTVAEAHAHVCVLRDGLLRRGYSRMAAYDAIGRQIGASSSWVRKLIGRQPDLAVYAHTLLNLREIALASAPKLSALAKDGGVERSVSVVDPDGERLTAGLSSGRGQ